MKIGIRVLVSVAVLAALLAFLPLEELWVSVRRLSPRVWSSVLAGFLAGHLLGVLKWRTMLRAGRAPLSWIDSLRCYSAGLFANLCLPSIVGGDVLRAILAGRASGRPEAVVIGSVGDRLCDMFALATLAAAGALLARAALPGWGANLLAVFVLLGLVAAVLVLPLASRRPLDAWPTRIRRPVGRTLVALRRLVRSPRSTAVVLALSFTIQTSFVLLNAWIGRAVGIELSLSAWFFAWPMAKVAGLLPVSLGGLGVRDATLGAVVAAFGVPMARGVAASLVWQTVLVAGGLVAGGIWLLLGRASGDSLGSVRIVSRGRPGVTG